MTSRYNRQTSLLQFPENRPKKAIALAALPDPKISRWTVSAKKAVLTAIRTDALSVIEACRRFGLTAAELKSWEERERRFGRNGLKATQITRFRRAGKDSAENAIILQPTQ